MELTKGDVVMHKSERGPNLVVVDTHADGTVDCRYFIEKEGIFVSGQFIKEELESIE